MTEPRLSTVFDFSNLRLHPDGTRVYQKSTNLAPRIAKVAVRTSRNNWIARDAGGVSNIRKYKGTKRTLQDLQEDGEEFIDLRTGTEEGTSPKPEEERKTKRFDGRTAKRRKFLENYDYLDKNGSTSSNLAADTGTESFPYEPSSDLLKCIHRYASEFYTESGQLLNSSRAYRKQREKAREEKKVKGRRTQRLTSKSKQYRDMYKVLDGSAIMAIGMLVQEYIAEALDPQPPDEWRKEYERDTGINMEYIQ